MRDNAWEITRDNDAWDVHGMVIACDRTRFKVYDCRWVWQLSENLGLKDLGVCVRIKDEDCRSVELLYYNFRFNARYIVLFWCYLTIEAQASDVYI